MQTGKSIRRMAIGLLILPLSTAVAGPIFDTPHSYAQASTNPEIERRAMEESRDEPSAEALARLGKLSMTEAQQDRLFSLMVDQAPERRIKRRTARKALAALQQLAVTDAYDREQAQRLAQTYGRALAELTLLDVQLASQFRTALTPEQQKMLEDTIAQQRLRSEAGSYGL